MTVLWNGTRTAPLGPYITVPNYPTKPAPVMRRTAEQVARDEAIRRAAMAYRHAHGHGADGQ